MEIRHRKQFLTGKMVAQVWFGEALGWRDADQSYFPKRGSVPPKPIPEPAYNAEYRTAPVDHDTVEIETLRSQLSEALNKIREYREAEEAAKSVIEAVQKYERAVADAFLNPGSEISKARAKAFRKPFKSEPAIEATEIKGKSPTNIIVDEFAQTIPHHGPGLSEAEDAMREGR